MTLFPYHLCTHKRNRETLCKEEWTSKIPIEARERRYRFSYYSLLRCTPSLPGTVPIMAMDYDVSYTASKQISRTFLQYCATVDVISLLFFFPSPLNRKYLNVEVEIIQQSYVLSNNRTPEIHDPLPET